MAVVNPIDRHKSVRNHCVIKVFGGFWCCQLVCSIFCWYKGFRHRTKSDLVLFLLTASQYVKAFPMLSMFYCDGQALVDS